MFGTLGTAVKTAFHMSKDTFLTKILKKKLIFSDVEQNIPRGWAKIFRTLGRKISDMDGVNFAMVVRIAFCVYGTTFQLNQFKETGIFLDLNEVLPDCEQKILGL